MRTDSPAGRERTGGLACREGAHFVEPLAVEHLGQQPHAPAAALAEIGTQREAVEHRANAISRQRVARGTNRLPLQLAATDGSTEASVGSDDHARPRLARGRSADLRHRHERATPVRGDHLRDHRPRPHPFSPPCASTRHPVRVRTTAIRLAPCEMCTSFAVLRNAGATLSRAGRATRRTDTRPPRLRRLRLSSPVGADYSALKGRRKNPSSIPSARIPGTAIARGAIGSSDSRTEALRNGYRSRVHVQNIP